jgi:hypothetical protein
MRVSSLLFPSVLVGLTTLTGCASKRPPRPPAAILQTEDKPSKVAPDAGDGAEERPADTIPRVIRRIVAEQKDLVERSLTMATELRDPRGRQRALAEANELAAELQRISAPIDGADSAVLDDTVNKLQLLDTRLVLLHERLRSATDRTTAVLVD